MADIGADIDLLLDPKVGRAARILESVLRAFRRRRAVDAEMGKARELLGIDPAHPPAYRHTSAHSGVATGTPHPDNEAALHAVASFDVARAAREDRLAVVSELTVDIEKSMVLIGSPTAEVLARDLFGYTAAADGENALRLTDAPLDLPFHWILDPELVDPGARAARVVRGHGLMSRPNWRIERHGGRELYVPEVDADGLLKTDFLLVTRVRNFLTKAATDRGSYVVSFGGAHGTATRAVELLLSDPTLLREIRDRLGPHPVAYQLLLEVGELTHDAGEGTRAHSIRLVAAEVLEDSSERWRTATETVRPRLSRWLDER